MNVPSKDPERRKEISGIANVALQLKRSTDPEFAKKWKESYRQRFLNRRNLKTSGSFKKGDARAIECGKKGGRAVEVKHPNHFSVMGCKSRAYENKIAKQIQADLVFKPQEVCDRIVVRQGQIGFIEIKLISI